MQHNGYLKHLLSIERIIKIIMKNKLLIRALSLLGFASMLTACDDIGRPTVEYGMPHTDFSVKGRVTDKAGTPIRDIRVVVHTPEAPYNTDTVYTDRTGYFLTRKITTPDHISSRLVYVKADDMDGIANGGSFATQEKTINIDKLDFKGGSGDWYMGHAKVEMDFKLEEKE